MTDDPVAERPCTLTGSTVDAGALDTEHGIDALKPPDRHRFPRGVVDVLVDTEEDGRRIRPPGRGVERKGPLGVGDASVVSAGEVRRCGPAGFAELIAADDVQPERPQAVRVLAGDRLEIEGGTRAQLGHIHQGPAVACRFDLLRGDQPFCEVDQLQAGGRCRRRA